MPQPKAAFGKRGVTTAPAGYAQRGRIAQIIATPPMAAPVNHYPTQPVPSARSFERETAYDDDTQATEAEMARYIGDNWPKYRNLWENMRHGDGLKPSFSFAALFFTTTWLIYRRQYLWAFGLFFGSLCLSFINPLLPSLIWPGITVYLSLFGKAVVIKTAMSNIASVKNTPYSPAERIARIEKSGGTNLAGALTIMGVVGFLTFIVMTAVVAKSVEL